jgi:hypothetical protein
LAEETEEERLDRLEREEEEKNAMKELETKTLDAKREMQIADALDEIRTRNARIERADGSTALENLIMVKDAEDEEREREEKEIEERARRAFMTDEGERVRRLAEEEERANAYGEEARAGSAQETPKEPVPTFRRTVKKKKDLGAALGIKKKPSLMS